jgi:hypothetical protein
MCVKHVNIKILVDLKRLNSYSSASKRSVTWISSFVFETRRGIKRINVDIYKFSEYRTLKSGDTYFRV